MILTATLPSANAQVRPMSSQFFFNQQLANPAMVAKATGAAVDIGYRQQSENIAGAPKMATIMGNYRMGNIGWGLQADQSRYGLMQQTLGMATIAYHLPVGENKEELSMGLSYGALTDKLNTKDFQGDLDDPLVAQYRDNKLNFDGNVGIAYTSTGLSVQASLKNFATTFKSKEEKIPGRSTFFTSVSYQFAVNEGDESITIEPKMSYRGVTGFDNIFEAGAELKFMEGLFGIQGIYHSYKAFSAGITGNYQSRLSLFLGYSSQPPNVKDYQKGDLELAVKFRF